MSQLLATVLRGGIKQSADVRAIVRQYWDNVETMLGQCWDKDGLMFGLCWANFETMFG